MILFMNSSNRGTVKVSPWVWLQIMPLAMRPERVGAGEVTLAAELIRDIAGAMGIGAEFRHGAKISLFTWCEAIETDPEEAFVECCHGFV